MEQHWQTVLQRYGAAGLGLGRLDRVSSPRYPEFHPYNLCPGGVIDLEFVHWSVAGYDTMTGLFADDLLPPAPADYRYTATQLTAARAAIDALFQRYHLPLPSHYLADFRLCRMMRIVQLAERRPLEAQQWIYQQYVTLATAYSA